MIDNFATDVPSVGIFWLVECDSNQSRLLTAGCSLQAAEPYGDFLTFADGHYEVWEGWRNIKDQDPALRKVVRKFEYEDWPRGRIVFDQKKKLFILYADRKLLRTGTIARIQDRFALPAKKTIIETDFHYKSPETPGPLR
jgi:hypothetical protein